MLSQRGFPRPKTLDEVEKSLDLAGDRRFQWKSSWLFQCIQAEGPNQASDQGLMEGLGYRTNQRPFIELASVVPYQVLAQAAGQLEAGQRCAAISGWLLGRSGFGGSMSAFSPNEIGESPPQPKLPQGLGAAMNREEWWLFRVRPTNHPRRRIMGAAVIIDRFMPTGLAAGLREVVQQLSAAKLTAFLLASGASGPAYVGLGRAKDLAVNVVLPFMHAWDQCQALERGEAEISSAAPGVKQLGVPEQLYRRFTLLAENEITREMTSQLLPTRWLRAVSNARRQQGLLHLSEVLKGAF